jgi:hypothetical protein
MFLRRAFSYSSLIYGLFFVMAPFLIVHAILALSELEGFAFIRRAVIWDYYLLFGFTVLPLFWVLDGRSNLVYRFSMIFSIFCFFTFPSISLLLIIQSLVLEFGSIQLLCESIFRILVLLPVYFSYSDGGMKWYHWLQWFYFFTAAVFITAGLFNSHTTMAPYPTL